MSAHSFADLLAHRGHKVEVVTYGPKHGSVEVVTDNSDAAVWNVAVECTNCWEVLIDFDNPDDE